MSNFYGKLDDIDDESGIGVDLITTLNLDGDSNSDMIMNPPYS